MSENLLDLENDSGESLHVCTGADRLWIGAHDGTDGGMYELGRPDAIKLIWALMNWVGRVDLVSEPD